MSMKTHQDLPTMVEHVILAILLPLDRPTLVGDILVKFNRLAYRSSRKALMLTLRNMEEKGYVRSTTERRRPSGVSGPARILFRIAARGRRAADFINTLPEKAAS